MTATSEIDLTAEALTWSDLGDLVGAVVAEDPVCEPCLGRVLAARSFGLTNRERGDALRVAQALVEDTPVEERPDPTECWVCEGHSAAVDTWADRAIEALGTISFRTYQVGCRVPPLLAENSRLLREQLGVDPEAGEPLQRELNREVGKRVGQRTETTVDLERPDLVILLELERGTAEVSINPAFVFGRYRKLERGIPQTEWPCRDCGGSGRELGPDGERDCQGCDGSGYRYDRSVEQLTVPHVVAAMDGSEGTFHGAGREDVDARMLGTGRPFVIEVNDPRARYPDPEQIAERINAAGTGTVEVTDLSLATHDLVERVKEHPADKTYRAGVTFTEPVSETALDEAVGQLAGQTIEQRTPTRVDHRRSDRVRTRTLREITADLTDERTAEVELTGEGGLYVKELLHGDGGRTTPSLAGVLETNVTVDWLDVLAVTATGDPFAPREYRIEA